VTFGKKPPARSITRSERALLRKRIKPAKRKSATQAKRRRVT
jgi:hypothetical protein